MGFPIKYIGKIVVVIVASILAFNAIATMLFGSLGKTPESSDWNYILTLYIFLASIGAISFAARLRLIAIFAKSKSKLRIFTIFKPLTAGLSFALLGFYYGGSMTDNNAQVAIITAIALGVLGTVLGLKPNRLVNAAVATIATIAAYGFAFYAGTKAIALFTASQLLSGILWGIICVIYLGITWKLQPFR